MAIVAATQRMRSGVQRAKSTVVRIMPAMMITPPIVGVPCFTRCVCGPSARTCWPMPSLRMRRMNDGMRSAVMRHETKKDTNTW